MRFRDLTNGEMISATATMADPSSEAHKAIASNALTAVVLGKLVEGHDGMENLQRPVRSPALAALILKLADLDTRHDNITRGVDAAFYALIILCTNDKRVAELAALRLFLLPDGLKIIARSYLEEAGQLRNLKATLSPAHAQLMKTLKLDDRTLHDVFVEWCDVGEQMRTLDLERASIEGGQQTTPSRADNLKARNNWIAAVNGLVAMADLAQLPDDVRQTIFGQLNALLERTAHRSKKPVVKIEPAPAPEPVVDPTAGGAE